jgi:hypothetical protein
MAIRNHQPNAYEKQQCEEHSIGVQMIQTHCYRDGYGKHGLDICIDARDGWLHKLQRVVEQQIW